MQNIVLLTAAGHGSRLGGEVAKQWHKINDISITEYTIRLLNRFSFISSFSIIALKILGYSV